jgi:hypothetical protein
MAHISPPPLSELPSPARLRRGAIAALVGALIVVVVVVLPAERAIDPTGIGSMLGLTDMGLIKQEFKAELAAETASKETQRIADSTTAAEKAEVRALLAAGTKPERTDTTTLRVKPLEQVSFEFAMQRTGWVAFDWRSLDGAVDFDLRGDTAGAPDWWYRRYERADSVRSGSGILVAKFTGDHGLYFMNLRDTTATVVVITRGSYSPLGRK